MPQGIGVTLDYKTKTEPVRIGDRVYQIRSLLDINQGPSHSEINAEDSNLNINDTNWPIFGQLWPAGCLLAEIVDRMDLRGLKILEVGCGLALAGIVAHGKGFDVTVSDYHPAAEVFLKHNLELNSMNSLKYIEANWSKVYESLGTFDMIIGSDLLYDREHPELLASFIVRHLSDDGRVIITDPGRQNYRKFSKAMEERGFARVSTLQKLAAEIGNHSDKNQFHVLEYQRVHI